MKVVYMGTPDFAVGPLEAIIKAGHEVTAVVTQPDKPKGRGKEMAMSPVKECALQYHIPVLTPVKIKAAEAVEESKQYPADIFVVAAFGQILSEEILNMPKYGCINIHASLLPKYRGAAPIQWSIIDGEEETGITIMQMDKGLDTGDILFQKKVAITAEETGESLFDKLALTGAEFVVEALERIEKGEDLYILLNSAGGYKRAKVVLTNLQVTDIMFGLPPAEATEPSDTEDAENEEPMEENYELLAFEWVETHIVELNARVNDAIGKGKSELLLKSDELPTRESWDDIRYELEKENITDTKCIPDGILIKLTR